MVDEAQRKKTKFKKKEEEFPLSKKLREKLELEEKLIKKKIKVKDYFKTLEMTPKQKKAFERDKRLLEATKASRTKTGIGPPNKAEGNDGDFQVRQIHNKVKLLTITRRSDIKQENFNGSI